MIVPTFQKGAQLSAVDLNLAMDAVRRVRVLPGVGVKLTETLNGTVVSVKPQRSSSAGDGFPFQIITQLKPGSTTGALQWGIAKSSYLFRSLKPNDKQTLTGLLSSTTPAPNDSGWKDMIAADAIWIGIVFDDATPQAITSATIDSWGTGKDFDVTAAAWSGDNGYLEDDGNDPPKFQTCRKLIGYSYTDAGNNRVIVQGIRQNQVLFDICEGGREAKYPMDHSGGYHL